jgi:hypothetical protein
LASIIANFHHRRIIPLMEKELRIFEMSDAANPTSLARSRLLQECLLKDYAATRVSGIHPGYSCKEGRRVEDGLLLEFPCTPTRTHSV